MPDDGTTGARTQFVGGISRTFRRVALKDRLAGKGEAVADLAWI